MEMFYLNTIEQLFLFVEQLDQLEVCLRYSRLLTGIPILAVYQNLRWNSNKTSLISISYNVSFNCQALCPFYCPLYLCAWVKIFSNEILKKFWYQGALKWEHLKLFLWSVKIGAVDPYQTLKTSLDTFYHSSNSV